MPRRRRARPRPRALRPRPVILLAPFVALLVFAALRSVLRTWRRSRRLAAVAGATDRAALEASLHDRDQPVREAAAERLVALAPASELVARVASLRGDA